MGHWEDVARWWGTGEDPTTVTPLARVCMCVCVYVCVCVCGGRQCALRSVQLGRGYRQTPRPCNVQAE